MSSLAFIFDIIFCCIITLIFLYRCGNYRRHHPITTVVVFVSWFFSILIVFILPLDISHATYRDCVSHLPTTIKPILDNSTKSNPVNDPCPLPWSYVDPKVYANLWRVVYWTSQVLTWLILPFMQSISETGEFSIKGKIRYAIVSNLIYYGTLLVIFIILVIYVATKIPMTFSTFMTTLVTASTTWGLFLLVLMLGYGLVQVPLNVFNHSRASYMLAHIQFKLSQLYNEKVDIEERLDSLVDDVTKFCLQIKPNSILRPYIEQIIKIVPEQYSNRIKLTMDDYENNRIALSNRPVDSPTEKQLIKLHERLKTSIHIHHRVQASWVHMINEAYYFEDIINNEKDTNHEFVKQNPLPPSWLRQKLFEQHTKLEWYTYCLLRPWALRVLGLALGAISIIVIWSEMTFFSTQPVVSIFAQCVNSARNNHAYFTIEVFCCLSIAYLCLCAFYTIFRIRILDYFYLSLYHLTDETSLIFAATFLCRLTAPLSYNFLGMIHLDQAITNKTDRQETAFTTIMGHLNAIKIISVGFNFYFPMLICLLSIGTFFRLGSRCLHACGFRQFFDDDDLSAEYVEDGKSLMRRERRNYGGVDTLANTTTAAERKDRRRELEEKYGLRSASAMAANNLYNDNVPSPAARPLKLLSSDDDDEPLLGSTTSINQRSVPTTAVRSDSSHQINPPTTTFNDI